MDRGIPVSSKLISKKINDKNMQIHLQKLQNIKSSISREPPKSFSHLKSNKKKVQVHETKLGEIERENRLLLEKLTTIMKTGPQEYQTNRVTPKSLNRDYRKRELVKITIENQAFLKRLQDLKPTYNRNNWENDRKQHELYLKNISEFGGVSFMKSPQEGDRPSTYQNPNAFSLTTSGSEQINQKFSVSTKNSAGQFNPSVAKKQAPSKLEPVPLSNQKTILFQTKKKIGFSNYLIHIYAHNNTFNIIASNNNRSDFKTLSISREEGIDLLRQFGDNYEELLNHIQFKGSSIIIKNSSYSVETSHDHREHNVSQEGIAETQEENEPKSSKSQKSKVPLDHQSSEEAQREQEDNEGGSRDGNKSAEVEEKEKTNSQSEAKEHRIEDEHTVQSEKGETTPLEKGVSQEHESLENEKRQEEESQERQEKSMSQKNEPRNPSPEVEQVEEEEGEKKETFEPNVINVQDEEEENYPEDNEQLENSQGEEEKKKFVSPADEEEEAAYEAVDEDL